MKVEELRYHLPEDAIAQSAAEPRDSARLLDTRDSSDHTFRDLPVLLRPGDLVVVNNTKVRRARLTGIRPSTGGVVELLVLRDLANGRYECLAKPARRLRPGTSLDFGGVAAEIVAGPDEGLVVVDFGAVSPEAIFETAGHIPLPPYFTGALKDEGRYQTIFAKDARSAAAPTAGLHFTDGVVSDLARFGIGMAEIELHVGIATFRPMIVDEVDDHQIQSEWCSVPEETAAAIRSTRAGGGRVVAVGTTTVRTLESFAGDDGQVRAGTMETDLFLRPGSILRVVDLLVTNFHMPGSTLLAMLAAFMGPTWREVYQTALDRRYRFLSFGDSMLCERAPR